MFSGGLDSASVLYGLSRLVAASRIVVVAVHLEDDLGASSAAVATRLAGLIDQRIQIVVATVDKAKPLEWFRVAPRIDAAPAHNDALI